MFKSKVLDYTSKNSYTVSFFEDDSIETVRQQIGKSMNIHPDRLFILVSLQLPADYYITDPRRWEKLFHRLSYNGQPIEKEPFQDYQLKYRSPNTSIPFFQYDRATWSMYPEELKEIYSPTSQFIENRILGVEEEKSFVLSLEFDNKFTSRISSADTPIPLNKTLFSTLYDHRKVTGFIAIPHDELSNPNELVYYPLLRSTTPNVLSEESIRLMNKNTSLLNGLLELKVPKEESVTIVKTRFYIPWVDTDFGSAIQTRFEQLFYGLTVSTETPYIGFFTSKEEVTRHKFYAEDPKDKKPVLDMQSWKTWWSLTKPARNIPTLLLYRGDSRHNFDRIAITDRDMVVSTHRPEGNTETIEELKESVSKWISTLDAIIPFIQSSNLEFERWELQDLSFLAKYKDKIEDFDLLRFHCISNIFDISDKTKSQFSLLRTDHENDGISGLDVKLLTMMREGNILKPAEIAEELSIPVNEARSLIEHIEARLEEDPRLGQKAFRGYPTLRVGPDFVIVSSVNNLQYPLQYSNILRYILSNPESDKLDDLCPRKSEKSAVFKSTIEPENLEVDAALIDEYSDLFEYAETDTVKGETQTVNTETPESEKISTEEKSRTIYSYFNNRLQEFDPKTFVFEKSEYPKKCEQKHQPIILSETDLKRVEKTEYDPRKYLKEDKIVDLEDPDGKLICPEYWCMKDQIALQESQLEHIDGVTRCPVCKGKLQTDSSEDPREFPLIKREDGFVYPGFVKYKSLNNGRNLPCCFKTAQTKKNIKEEKENEDKYYILSETKSDIGKFRNAFLSESFIKALEISENYVFFKGNRRLLDGTSGFFRVGLGRPSENLPKFLNLTTKIPSPRESIETVLKCSFLRNWTKYGDDKLDDINNKLKKISPFEEDTLVRENLARIISGIDEAYSKQELSLIEELEYCALVLQCDVFRIFLDSNALGCMFYAKMVRPRTRGIIVLQTQDEIDILSYVTRLPRGFEYKSNIFESPFKKETYVELEKMRNSACLTEIPSYETALKVISQIATEEYNVVLDPFGRGQAFYIPDKVVLPFSPTPLPDINQAKLSGYSQVTKLPTHKTVLDYLKIAEKTTKGYKWVEDLANNQHQISEVLTESGLRIPIKPTNKTVKSEQLEVIETIQNIGESKLVFGEDSQELKRIHDEISYASEVYEFLLFQLTKDLENDYKELRFELQEVLPKQSKVEPLLKQWFNETTQFVNIEKPQAFLSKIRTPCGQFTNEKSCSGNMCGWDGKVCRIQIRKLVKSDSLFHRLLSTLIENSKIRSMILDGRTTPFFSTILYLELPHELILTDNEL